MSSLSGGQVFSKLDLRQAYAQLKLSDESQKLCVISTHRGLYAFTRLPFGVCSAPSIWQRVMEQIVNGIPGVCVYFDDLLISAESRREHDVCLRSVLSRFRRYGVRVSREKCVLLQNQVKYLGYVVSQNGLSPDGDKVRAIVSAPAPHDVHSLQSFSWYLSAYKACPHQSAVEAVIYSFFSVFLRINC